MMEEEWRVIKDFPDYAVSNMGRVKRVKDSVSVNVRKAGLFLKPSVNKGGYLQVTLCKNGSKFTAVIHKLVLDAFVGKKTNPEYNCNHKDGCKINNCLNNLEWVSHKENVKHAFNNGLVSVAKGEKCGRSKLKTHQIFEIRAMLENKSITQSQIAEKYGVCQQTISKVKTNQDWRHVS